ncbi:uncharacterized protein K02A2.6-like [Capsicum annuum]|uniref:uncharacterized protein K02A2.6-like n=1 Tax=Capsicum annuum TaxID=4072 RepID=UPI0007BECF0D|nr:uncharacterized protein K02A2.6-like [Capsicum annuum]
MRRHIGSHKIVGGDTCRNLRTPHKWFYAWKEDFESWILLERDNIRYEKKCHQCQVHGDFIQVPPNELNVMGSPWLFVAWGMDVIEPTEPLVSNGYHFILVAINYFIKCVEASTHKAITMKMVEDFVRNNLVCGFGILESIIIDNGANLNNDLMREICERLKISYQNSTAYRPQMNGAVEATKNIKRILRMILDANREWHEKLPYALLGHHIQLELLLGQLLTCWFTVRKQ